MWFRRKKPDPKQWEELNRAVMELSREQRLEEALAGASRLLKLSRREYGKSHPNLVTALNNLGIIQTLRRELDEAESYLLAALQMSEKINGKISNEVAVVNMNLGKLYTLKATLIQEELARVSNASA